MLRSTQRHGLVASMLALFLASSVPAQTTLRLTGVESMGRVFKTQPVTGSAAVSISAAHNEYESFQVAMTASGGSVQVANAVMSALSGPGGAVIPSSAAELYRVEYVNVANTSMYPLPGFTAGSYPDPLIPFVDPVNGQVVHQSRGYAKYALPIDIPSGENRAVWVDISVPKTVPAGTYAGTFTVTLSTNASHSIPVSLTVWDFTLPDWPTLQQFWIPTFWYATQFYGVSNGTPAYYALERRHADLFKKHRMVAPLPDRFTPQPNANGSLRYTEYPDSLKAWLRDYNPNVFRFPTLYTPESNAAFSSYFANMKNWLAANGMGEWIGKAWYYLHDEPGSSAHYSTIAQRGALVPPDIPCLVTEQTYPENTSWTDIDPAVDIWCPLWGFMDEKSQNAKLANGDKLWTYQCCSQYTPDYHPNNTALRGMHSPWWQIDRPVHNYRFPAWINYRYRATGFLYWQVMAPSLTDPWTSAWDGYSNGEGMLIYPGTNCGFSAPCPSIRMKIARDSMDDYEYMTLLEKSRGRAAVLGTVRAVCNEWYEYASQPSSIEQARATFATSLSAGQPPVDIPASPAALRAVVPDKIRPSTSFPVSLHVENVTELFGLGFVLRYPDGVTIEPNSATAGTFLGEDTVFFFNTDETARQIQVGVTNKSGQPGATGGGMVMSLRFIADSATPNGTILPFSITEVLANTPSDAPLVLNAVADTATVITALDIWPGDTNNDGVVSQADVLPLGLYWGKTGPQREKRSNAWSSQPSLPWTPEPATYADSNGDGIVNQNDVLTIGLNWARTAAVARRALSVKAAESAPSGSVIPQTDATFPVREGDEFWANIEIRDIESLFGMSLRLTYNRPDLIEAIATESGAFLGRDILFFPRIDTRAGHVAAGLSRTTGQTGVDGSGTMLRVKFKAISPIPAGTRITLSIHDISASDAAGNPIAVGTKEQVIGDTALGTQSIPYRFHLEQNHPNPFNPATTIRYELPENERVRLEVLNIAGQVVRVMVDSPQSRGRHSVVWNAHNDQGRKVSAGVYLVRLKAGSHHSIMKMLLLP